MKTRRSNKANTTLISRLVSKTPVFRYLFCQTSFRNIIQKDMDLEKVEVVSEFLVGERLGHKVVDVLFKVPYKDGDAFIYILVEHQSTPDPMMPFRLVLYLFLICDEWRRKQQEKAEEMAGEEQAKEKMGPKKLPVIFPMV